jgi:uncharacterized metal-binding protein YceD (DUF177 family)
VDVNATIKVMNTVKRCVVRVILQLDLRVSKLLYRWHIEAAETSDVQLVVFMIDGTLQSLSLNVFQK